MKIVTIHFAEGNIQFKSDKSENRILNKILAKEFFDIIEKEETISINTKLIKFIHIEKEE